MAYYFAEGSKFYFSQTFAAAKTVSAVTNANPAVATSTSHGYVDNDEILLSSGWEDATDTVYMIDQQTADTFKLLGLNSTDTDWYASGGGTGEAFKISTWVEIPQLLSISATGGDARFTNIDLLAKRNSLAVPTGFNASQITLSMAHDPALAGYQTMVDISRTLTKVAFKIVLSGGGLGYGYGYLSVSEMPQLGRNQVNTVQASMSLIGRFMTYAT
jgi:hypothetical protein